MKLPDANILIYAVDQAARSHATAKLWLENSLNEIEQIGFAWPALIAFVRLSTKANFFAHPLTSGQAFDYVDEWLAQPNALIVSPTSQHGIVLRKLLQPLSTAGNLVPDAHLAALAIEHGATLYSFDNDFSRFQGIKWIDPSKPQRQ